MAKPIHGKEADQANAALVAVGIDSDDEYVGDFLWGQALYGHYNGSSYRPGTSVDQIDPLLHL
jgi:hypothetical protein